MLLNREFIRKTLELLFSGFCITLKPSHEQAVSSRQRLRELMTLKVGCIGIDSRVVYGYTLKHGLTATHVSSYAIGFCDDSDSFVIVPVDLNAEKQTCTFHQLDQTSMVSVTATNMRHEKLFTSPLLKNGLRIITPHYTCSSSAECTMLPILQTEEVMAFERMLQKYYGFVPHKRLIRREWL